MKKTFIFLGIVFAIFLNCSVSATKNKKTVNFKVLPTTQENNDDILYSYDKEDFEFFIVMNKDMDFYVRIIFEQLIREYFGLKEIKTDKEKKEKNILAKKHYLEEDLKQNDKNLKQGGLFAGSDLLTGRLFKKNKKVRAENIDSDLKDFDSDKSDYLDFIEEDLITYNDHKKFEFLKFSESSNDFGQFKYCQPIFETDEKGNVDSIIIDEFKSTIMYSDVQKFNENIKNRLNTMDIEKFDELKNKAKMKNKNNKILHEKIDEVSLEKFKEELLKFWYSVMVKRVE